MMNNDILQLSEADREETGRQASQHSTAEVRRRVWVNLLARLAFRRWALERGLAVGDRDTLSQDVNLVELLDLNDVRIGAARINVSVTEGPGERRLMADSRSLACGFGADIYAFMEVSPELDEARLVGIVPASAFEEGDYDSAGDYRVLDRDLAAKPEDLTTLLKQDGNAFEPLDPDFALPHDLVQPRLPAYQAGKIDAMERPGFELHLYNCAACRKSLVRLRFLQTQGGPALVRAALDNAPAERKSGSRRPRRSGPVTRMRDAADYLFAMAGARYPRRAPVSGGPEGLAATVPPDEQFYPRCTAAGSIEGTFVFSDRKQWEGRKVRVDIDLPFGGERIPVYEREVRDGRLSIAQAELPAAAREWITTNLRARNLDAWRLPIDRLHLTMV